MSKLILLSAVGMFAIVGPTNGAPVPDRSSRAFETVGPLRTWQTALRADVKIEGDVKAPALTLAGRMQHYQVPALSVAIIDRCRIIEANAFGVVSVGGPAVNVETLFQAGSISKAITALGVMRLVDRRRLALDKDVSESIVGWPPRTDSNSVAGPVTLRQLLSHTAGANVHGFKGYLPGEPMPTINQVLSGEAPANSGPVRLVAAPGTEFRYSGGGYAAVQALLMQTTRQAFPQMMKRLVFAPLGMRASTFQQTTRPLLPLGMATGHDKSGEQIKGQRRIHPEMAAAGLWTNPSELALAIIATMRAYRGERMPGFISAESAKVMLRPMKEPWGLGFQLSSQGGKKSFMHGGETEGYVSYFAGVPGSCQGAVVMSNANSGAGLVKEVLRAIADTHGWPDIWPSSTLRRLETAQITSLAGSYRVKEPSMLVELRPTKTGLEFYLNGRPQGRLLSAADRRFVLLTPTDSILAHVTIGANSGGAAALEPTLGIQIGDRQYKAERVPT